MSTPVDVSPRTICAAFFLPRSETLTRSRESTVASLVCLTFLKIWFARSTVSISAMPSPRSSSSRFSADKISSDLVGQIQPLTVEVSLKSSTCTLHISSQTGVLIRVVVPFTLVLSIFFSFDRVATGGSSITLPLLGSRSICCVSKRGSFADSPTCIIHFAQLSRSVSARVLILLVGAVDTHVDCRGGFGAQSRCSDTRRARIQSSHSEGMIWGWPRCCRI